MDFDGVLNYWDLPYYATMVEEKTYSVDKEALREFFPLEKVTQGLFKIYQDLLGLKFTECTEDPDKWHDDVRLVRPICPEASTLGHIYWLCATLFFSYIVLSFYDTKRC